MQTVPDIRRSHISTPDSNRIKPTYMKQIAIFLITVCTIAFLSGCEEKQTLPYIPVEETDEEIPHEGEDVDPLTVNYQLDKVLQCDPVNTDGTDITNKLDFFSSPARISVSISPTKTLFTFENGELIPFYPFAEELQSPVECELDTAVVPNELRRKDTGEVLATFENDGFVISFHLDSKSLTYKYKFKSIN